MASLLSAIFRNSKCVRNTGGSLFRGHGLVSSSKSCSDIATPSQTQGNDIPMYVAVSMTQRDKKIQDQVQEGLESIKSLETLNQHVRQSTISKPLEASIMLLYFCELCQKQSLSEEKVLELLKSREYSKLVKTLHENVTEINPSILLNCLGSLMKLSTKDNFLIQSLEMHVLWILKRLPISQIFKVIDVHSRHKETTLRKQVHSEALLMAQNRWTEIQFPKDLISLMYHAISENDTDLLVKLEEKAQTICENAGTKDLYRMFYILGKARRRNGPLLKALAYHLNKNELTVLSPVHLTNLLFSCAILNFADAELLEQICKVMLTRIPEFDVRLLSATVKSLGLLRWRDPAILDALAACCVKQVDRCTAGPLLYTCATLGYLPQDLEKRHTFIIDALQSLQSSEPKVWLDAVWSLAVLELLDQESASVTLGAEFVHRLEDKNMTKRPFIQLKLMNISAAARLDLNTPIESKVLPNLISASTIKIPNEGKKAVIMKELVEVLGKIAPEKYRATDIVTNDGYKIDIELLVNAKGEAQILQENKGSNTRIAIKTFNFDDVSRHTPTLLGFHQMAVRHLSKSGYKVVQIMLNEFKEQDGMVKKVQYLQTKIKNAIQ